MSLVVDVDVRFRDFDSLGHVNNAVYATYCEQARAKYLREVLGAPLSELSLVVAHLELDYRAPVEGLGTVAVEVEVGEPGDRSFPLTYELRYEGSVVATGQSVQVVLDEDGNPTPVPDDWREAMADES